MPNPILVPTGLGDLVKSTLRELTRLRWTDLTTDLTQLTAMSSLLQKNRTDIQSGIGIQWDVMVRDGGGSANVGLAAPDQVAIIDTLDQATAEWRNTVSSWALIGQEVAMNREPARIVNLIKSRRIGALIAHALLMEANVWGPPVAYTDNVTPWGVNTWIVKNATEGFNGGVPSGWPTIGGLSPTTYPRWNNYTAPYTVVSKDGLLRTWKRATRRTNFRPPVAGIPSTGTGGRDMGYYTNLDVILGLEDLLESQNDNLGSDLYSQDGNAMFQKREVMYVPYLDRDTTNPVYGINWSFFKTAILQDWWLRETVLPNYPGYHTMAAQFLDSTYNFVCYNRRVNFVLSNGTTTPS